MIDVYLEDHHEIRDVYFPQIRKEMWEYKCLTNSWGRVGYGGPCPPSGVHRYFFKLYAIDEPLALDESATKEEVLAAMEGHTLMETELMGTYSASGG